MEIATVRIEDCCRTDRYLAHDVHVRPGDLCIVCTERGVELGVVKRLETGASDPAGVPEARKVLRRASQKDLAQYAKKKAREEKAWETCREMIRKHQLQMKLARVECLFDGTKIVFYYTADGRVDFRGLVKDLASTLKTRIEMRQIGVRDEARLLGGVGCCGLSLCCASWLKGFRPVSIRVAKKQCMNLNPSRLSGVCGRLMCCLMYEAPGKGQNGEGVVSEESVFLSEKGDA